MMEVSGEHTQWISPRSIDIQELPELGFKGLVTRFGHCKHTRGLYTSPTDCVCRTSNTAPYLNSWDFSQKPLRLRELENRDHLCEHLYVKHTVFIVTDCGMWHWYVTHHATTKWEKNIIAECISWWLEVNANSIQAVYRHKLYRHGFMRRVNILCVFTSKYVDKWMCHILCQGSTMLWYWLQNWHTVYC